MQINKCDITLIEEKSYDHFNKIQKKAFDKTQHFFNHKNPQQIRYRKNVTEHNKAHIRQPHS